MHRSLFILLLVFLLSGCGNRTEMRQVKFDYPELSLIKNLPEKIHLIGTVREVSYGLCGTYCQGGYIKVDVGHEIPNFNFKSVYVITACLSLDVKEGNKIDVVAVQHTGKETECYYQDFNRPKVSDQIVFYQLDEQETRKVR